MWAQLPGPDDSTNEDVDVGTLWVRPEPASAGMVRRTVSSELTHAGLPADIVYDALLVATELVTNSIRHATALKSGYLGVQWELDPSGITVSVSDGGGTQRPAVRDAVPGATTGRGLAIIEAVSDDWGVSQDPDGITVWAHLPAPLAPSPSANGGHRWAVRV